MPKQKRGCVYCGRNAIRQVFGVTVCPNHEDLPPLDPSYNDRARDVADQWAEARGSQWPLSARACGIA